MMNIGLCISKYLTSEIKDLVLQAFPTNIIHIGICSDSIENLTQEHHDVYIIEYRLINKDFSLAAFQKAILDSLVIYIMNSEDSLNPLIPLIPFNYIRQPIDKENFIFIMKCAYNKFLTVKSHRYPCRINGGITYIDLTTIKYFVSSHRKVIAKSISGSEIAFYSKLDDIEQDLKEYGVFTRITKSYLINLCYVDKFNSTRVMVGGETFSISRNRKDKVISDLNSYEQNR